VCPSHRIAVSSSRHKRLVEGVDSGDGRPLFGEAPAVTAVHAWLETAVIRERVPGLDMVSFGPQIEAPHSPDERVEIATVERFWRLLVGVVDEFSARTPA
jgi:di/tripeptidase